MRSYKAFNFVPSLQPSTGSSDARLYQYVMIRVNYNDCIFRGRTNSESGEVGVQTKFLYRRSGDRIWATYEGGEIVGGHLQGKVNSDGSLKFVYHHENVDGELMAGKWYSVPNYDIVGNLVLKEKWQWLTGDRASGSSEVEEITDHS